MIPPIQTVFDGVRYRSRTEARWAVFLRQLGLRFVYESECYCLPDGRLYLPDFWLPDHKVFIEVKGEDPTPAELAAADGLVRVTGPGTTVLIAAGPPGERLGRVFPGDQVFEDAPELPLYGRIECCPRCSGHVLAIYQDPEGIDTSFIHALGPHPNWADCNEKVEGAGPPHIAIRRALNERFGVHPD